MAGVSPPKRVFTFITARPSVFFFYRSIYRFFFFSSSFFFFSLIFGITETVFHSSIDHIPEWFFLPQDSR